MKTTDSGIYRIRNLVNGKCYYGSSANLLNRKSGHLSLLRKGAHHSVVLQRAWNKYGEIAFTFEIVAVLEISELLATEQKFIHLGVYNASKEVRAPMRGLKHSMESRKRMRESAKKRQPITDETRTRIREAAIQRETRHPNAMFGRTQTSETRRKISEAAKRRYAVQPKYHSPETRRRMSDSGRKNWIIRKQQAFEGWWCELATRHSADHA